LPNKGSYKSEASGYRKEAPIFDVEITKLPPGIDLNSGGMLRVGSHAGKDSGVIIANIDDQVVTLDGNHPLAGKVLDLEIQLVEIL
jgi:peptidylprolyl isomerase